MSDYAFFSSAAAGKDDLFTAFDWPSLSTATSVYAPHPEAFDADLDAALSSTGSVDNSLDLLRTLTQSFERTTNVTDVHRAIPSTFSVSTASAATASVSGYGDSEYYNVPSSPYNLPTSPLFGFQLDDMNLQSAAIDTQSLFPQAEMAALAAAAAQADYHYPSPPPSASPAHISPMSLPSEPSPATSPYPAADSDPTRKFQCPSCPRAFARQYNLKTHMETHSPNRVKAHVCPVKTCRRGFSRKHDLGRHLIAIHGDRPTANRRQRCLDCGRSWQGREKSCDCDEYK